MKNQRLTQNEIIELRNSVDEIRHFASMESASFGRGNEEIDRLVKENVRLYMHWFNSIATKIESILDDTYKDLYY